MRIRRIEEMDFRKNEATLYAEFKKANKAFTTSLKAGDVVALLAKSGRQIIFVHGFTEVDETTRVLTSTKYRISGGGWNPLRLRNYAEEAGLKIEGLKLFEEHYKRLVTPKAVKAAAKKAA